MIRNPTGDRRVRHLRSWAGQQQVPGVDVLNGKDGRPVYRLKPPMQSTPTAGETRAKLIAELMAQRAARVK